MSPLATSLIKPSRLREGDTIGIVAPASHIKRADLDAGANALRQAGYHPFYFESILDQDFYFAGSAERRVRELEDMFTRDKVKAILCARGGYGANYLLPLLDLEKIRSHPKILVGYSDLTSLLTYLLNKTGLVTFHGPMVTKDWALQSGVDIASWQAALTGASGWELGADSGVTGLLEGAAEGILYGGCLSILVASLGTPYEIETQDTILFIEDVGEKPYQIDRMLMQLKLAGKFKYVRGLVFGEMKGCSQGSNQASANQSYTLQEVIVRVVGDLGVPVAYGLRSGHVSSGNLTLPFGVRASLTVKNSLVNLGILEAAVS